MKQGAFFQVLLSENILSEDQLKPFEGFSDRDLFKIAKEKYLIKETELLSLAAKAFSITFQKLSSLIIDDKLVSTFNKDLLIKERVIPIFYDEELICFAVDNPYVPFIEEWKQKNKKQVQLILVSSADLDAYFGISNKNQAAFTLLDRVLSQAIDRKASDIHLNKSKDTVEVFFRVNGELYFINDFVGEEQKQLTSLIKLHSKMDIALLNKPQDGRLSYSYKTEVFDIRVSSLPTVYGEDFVFRLFNIGNLKLDISNLGFCLKAKKIIEVLLRQKSGMILVTGATGSGKTTTLYTFLSYLLKKTKKNIITLEDPVETVLPGIRQSQVNSQIGYGFVEGLRAILRQDPDILMIGEIRDKETAKIALQAAYTGHLVLSTLHTSDCRSTLFRLQGFQLDPFLVSQTLKGVISQKLVLKLCQFCHIKEEKDETALGFEYNYLPNGCPNCNYSGYKGRVVLNEILNIAKGGYNKKVLEDIDMMLDNNCYYSFDQDIRQKVNNGITSYKDVLKEHVF